MENILDFQEIHEGKFYVTDKSWIFGIDGKKRQFGLLIEIADHREFDEDVNEDYPYSFEVSIVADKPHKSWWKQNGNDGEPRSKLDLIEAAHSYMGGVPVTHTLLDSINGGLKEAVQGRSAMDVTVKKIQPQFGTVAAQRGKECDFRYPLFRDSDLCFEVVKKLVEERSPALAIMIGFVLDSPINLMREPGWKLIKTMVKGK